MIFSLLYLHFLLTFLNLPLVVTETMNHDVALDSMKLIFIRMIVQVSDMWTSGYDTLSKMLYFLSSTSLLYVCTCRCRGERDVLRQLLRERET